MFENRIAKLEKIVHDALWLAAKAGWQKFVLWSKAQYEIDGDWIQTDEILDEFIEEFKTERAK